MENLINFDGYHCLEQDFRLIAMIHFNRRTVYIRFIGTHREYDQIDCSTI
jgi:mRNA-degrading endonuclease HigB of HigAB toxin-antitoxin module